MIQYAVAYTHTNDIVRFLFGYNCRYDALAAAESLCLRSKKYRIISVFAVRSLTSIDVRNIANDPSNSI